MILKSTMNGGVSLLLQVSKQELKDILTSINNEELNSSEVAIADKLTKEIELIIERSEKPGI